MHRAEASRTLCQGLAIQPTRQSPTMATLGRRVADFTITELRHIDCELLNIRRSWRDRSKSNINKI